MPQHKSSEKRVRQSKRRNAHNRAQKSEMKKLIKGLEKLVESKSKAEEIEKAYRAAVQKLDRMSVKRYIHKNNASNKKSRLTKMVNKATASN